MIDNDFDLLLKDLNIENTLTLNNQKLGIGLAKINQIKFNQTNYKDFFEQEKINFKDNKGFLILKKIYLLSYMKKYFY